MFVSRLVCGAVVLLCATVLSQAEESTNETATNPSGQGDPTVVAGLTEGGVAFTFDDRNFDDWVRAIPLFDEFSVKATFFISGEIDTQAINAIAQLKRHGHAIGSHSVNHLKAVEYFQEHSPEQFVKQEINPQLKQFAQAGVVPASFAYPMSRNDEATDKSLLDLFRHVRTGRNIERTERLNEVDQFFVPAGDIAGHGCLYAKGIDHVPDLSLIHI